MQFRRFLPLLSAGLIAAGLGACDNDPERTSDLGPIPPREPIPVTRYLSGVEMEGADGAYSIDAMPEGDGAAPVLTGSAWFVRGGSMVATVTVEDTATALYVSTTNADIGYFTVPLDGSAAAIENDRVRARVKADKAGGRGRDARHRGGDDGLPRPAYGDPGSVARRGRDGLHDFGALLRRDDRLPAHDQCRSREHDGQFVGRIAGLAQLDRSDRLRPPRDHAGGRAHLLRGQGVFERRTARPRLQRGLLDRRINNENVTWGTTSPSHGEYTVRVGSVERLHAAGAFPVSDHRGDRGRKPRSSRVR